MPSAHADPVDSSQSWDSSTDAIDQTSDHELMVLCGQGSGEALDVLYRRYEQPLLAFVGRFIGDRQAAEDVMQEAFLRIYKAAPEYEPRSRFSTWLYRIATNLCLNELRYRRSHPFVSLNATVTYAVSDSESEEMELQDLLPDPAAACPQSAVESGEMLDEIRRAVGELPEGQQQVISLYVWDDMKLSEVADTLQCAIGTVKSRAHYGLRSVRQKLERGMSSDENTDK